MTGASTTYTRSLTPADAAWCAARCSPAMAGCASASYKRRCSLATRTRRRVSREQLLEQSVNTGTVQRQPAVDDDVLAGDEPRHVRTEEDDDVSNVFGLADPTE